MKYVYKSMGIINFDFFGCLKKFYNFVIINQRFNERLIREDSCVYSFFEKNTHMMVFSEFSVVFSLSNFSE